MADAIMDYLRAAPGACLGFFGYQLASAPTLKREALVAGRWRTSLIVGFLLFNLLSASVLDEEWVAGGLEFDFEPVQATESAMRRVVRSVLPLGARPPALVPAVEAGAAPRRLQTPNPQRLTASFSFGLDTISWNTQFVFAYTQETADARILLGLLPFIRNAVAAAKSSDPEFLELSGIDTTRIAATQGLLNTAIVLQVIAFVLTLLASYRLPALGQWLLSKTPLVVKAAAPLATFFASVAIFNYSGSGLQKAFCDALDPDPSVTLKPCQYGYGYNLGVVAMFVGGLWCYLVFRVVPWDDIEEAEPAGAEAGSGLKVGGYSGISSDSGASAGESASSGAATSFQGGYQSAL